MRSLLLACTLLAVGSSTTLAQDYRFEGPWKTTNRKLDGIMKCELTELANQQWQGRFYGVWQLVPFDYTVTFSGPASQLTGTALIDGASYQWTGSFDQSAPSTLKAAFDGSRYKGSFALKETWRRQPIAIND